MNLQTASPELQSFDGGGDVVGNLVSEAEPSEALRAAKEVSFSFFWW